MKIRSDNSKIIKLTEETGASQGLLLVLLVVLMALFGYLYFFTGLITQRDVQQKSQATAVQSVKQPIPPRPANDNNNAATPPVKSESKVGPVAPAPPTSAAPKVQPVTPPNAPQQVAPKATPAAAPKTIPVPVAKPQPTAAQKTQSAAKPAPQGKTPVKQTDQAVKSQMKSAADSKPPKTAPETATKIAKPLAFRLYRINATGIVKPDKVNSIAAQMKKSGLNKVEIRHISQDKNMHRLFVSEFTDSQSAHAELDNLKKLATGAFLLPESGKYSLYAGSYDQQKRADGEAIRLTAQGVNATVRKVKIKMPLSRLTATTADSAKAGEWVKKLKRDGFVAEVLKDRK